MINFAYLAHRLYGVIIGSVTSEPGMHMREACCSTSSLVSWARLSPS